MSASAARASTFVVNPEGTGDFPNIQAAINGAADGDMIELTDGLFLGDGNRDIDFLGKAVVVLSQSGDPTTCLIDCQGSAADPHRGFSFVSSEPAASRIQGITITGGWVTYPEQGGAIRCGYDAGPTISNCVLSQKPR